jgi:hypothetical protein
MALQTSGAISFSQIAAHFGGSGSHSLSEYHALAGKGVSGIPSSGAISFSHFHGKSNQVTTSVWVSSGYNTSSWVRIQTRPSNGMAHGGYGSFYWNSDKGYTGFYSDTAYGGPNVNRHLNNSNNRNYVWTIGNYRYSKGGYDSGASPKTTKQHGLNIDQYQTTWVDTSAYQNQTTTAQITT